MNGVAETNATFLPNSSSWAQFTHPALKLCTSAQHICCVNTHPGAALAVLCASCPGEGLCPPEGLGKRGRRSNGVGIGELLGPGDLPNAGMGGGLSGSSLRGLA